MQKTEAKIETTPTDPMTGLRMSMEGDYSKGDTVTIKPETTEQEYKVALLKIKEMVCGERMPRWDGAMAVSHTRMNIADIIDVALGDHDARR